MSLSLGSSTKISASVIGIDSLGSGLLESILSYCYSLGWIRFAIIIV
jgi:hypothetical protein